MKLWHWLGIALLVVGGVIWYKQSNMDMTPKLPAPPKPTTSSSR